MYQALYRTWRPRRFADVVGQDHITGTLRREVAEGRLSHAYLFTGTRGTGKTSCAKILARAVNCLSLQNGDPCNECAACLAILSGACLDVMELDAASHSGVDNIRALREEAVYAPSEVRRRVYIIDEVHMLSTGAFNALLTILEEPPAHILFILATTETHKVPATILSRCQQFAFKRIGTDDIARQLVRVADGIGKTLIPEAAALLARLADGSLRDALSLLDQCFALCPSPVDVDPVYKALGMAGGVRTRELAAALARQDVPRTLSLFATLYEDGREPAVLLDELSLLFRDLLLFSYLPENTLSGRDATREELASLFTQWGRERLLQALSLLSDTQSRLPRSKQRRVETELCLMRLCTPELSGDTAALAARLASLENKLLLLSSAPVPITPPPVDDAKPSSDSIQQTSVSTPGSPAAPIVSACPDTSLGQAMLDTLSGKLSPPLMAFLQKAQWSREGTAVTVHVDEFAKTMLSASQSLLTQAACTVLGANVSVFISATPPSPLPDPLDHFISQNRDIVTIE